MCDVKSVAILPDIWYYEVSGYPARCLMLSQRLSFQISDIVRSVAILPDAWCYISGYPARCLVL